MNTLKLNLVIAAWFTVILTVALLLTSCAAGHHCDAYGQTEQIDNGDIASK